PEERRQGPAHDAAAEGVPVMIRADALVAADGLILPERAAGDGQGGVIQDGPPAADGGEGAEAATAGQGLVVGELSGVDAGHADAVERQAALVQDAAAGAGVSRGAAVGQPGGDGQAGDGHIGAGLNVEDSAGVVAADGQLIRARAQDLEVVGDCQLAAGQGDL